MLVVIVIVDVRDIVTVIISAIDDVHIARFRRRDRLRGFEEEHGADEYTEDDEEEDRAPSHATTPPCATVSSSSRTFHCRHGASCFHHHLVYSFVVVYDFSIMHYRMHYRMHYLDQSHACMPFIA